MSILLFLALTGVLVFLDLGVKGYIENSIKRGESHDYAKGKITIRKVYNEGMALNVLSQKPLWVKRISLLACLAVTVDFFILLVHRGIHLRKLGMALLVGGAWGNLLDRYLRGHVIDFISFKSKWKRLSNITFNFADFFIFFGGFILILTSLKSNKKK